MSSADATSNRLAGETSPYLLQHAGNPVDWHPWGAEALERARREDKPILLSVGYSACHWCHVMAHESFEDAETAALMNTLFINIKVDREERPDLDKIYQTAHQILAQRAGGWPLTMFLMPDDHMPFFGGTYFPREPRHGLPAFKELLQRVADFFRLHRDELRRQNDSLREVFDRLTPRAEGVVQPDARPIAGAVAQLTDTYDARYGGFGPAPKFPHPDSLALLLSRRDDREATGMALHTLRCMAQSGLQDQLGGGFCRYSTDERWMIPHFEKMLYDNGALLALYAQAANLTGDLPFVRTALRTGLWVMREMQSPEGGYYSALDADSEGEEGRFYVWSQVEVKAILGDDYALFAARYGLDRPANFEGHWHLHVMRDDAALAAQFKLDEDQIGSRLDRAGARLLKVRERRIRPGSDDKVLTSWNALMIKGMAIAGRLLGRDDFIESAERALAFLRTTLWRDGRLLATCKDGRAHLPAYLDDHAYLIDALLSLLSARWRSADLYFAVALADLLLEHFEDRADGGFFFTADDHERLIQRPKPFADEATPSGNGIAAQVLLRLGHLLGETRYLDAAERVLHAAWPAIAQTPYVHGSLLFALEESLTPPQQVILRGTDRQLREWWNPCMAGADPHRMVFAIPDDAGELPAALAARTAQGTVTAYVCTGTSCSAPITDMAVLRELLSR
jgi:uncharacterized protein YyaL (SSP411 family)